MKIPNELQYTRTHEWVQKLSDGKVHIGLTDYAQDKLGDLVFISLPGKGDALVLGRGFADVESVKAVSEIFSPVSGVVSASNGALEEDPAVINESPYGAWLIEADEITDWDDLLTADQYKELIEAEAKEG